MDLALGVKDVESIVTIDGIKYTDYVFGNSLSGYIYIIKNNLSGKVYIGQTSDLKQRINSHKKELINFSHENEEMVLDCFLFGIESFSFDVICFISSSENILETELNFIKFFNSYYPIGYNLLVGRQPKYQEMSSRKIHELSYLEINNIKNKRIREFYEVSSTYFGFFNLENQEMRWIIKNRISKGNDVKIKVNYLLGKDYMYKLLRKMDGLSFSESSKESISIISEFSRRRGVPYEGLELPDVVDWLNRIFPAIPYLLEKTEEGLWTVRDLNYEKIIDLFESKLGNRFYKEEIESFRKEFRYLYMNCGKRKSYARFVGINQINKILGEMGIGYKIDSYRDSRVARRDETYWYITKY